MVMVTWNLGFLEIWVAHEFWSVKLKLMPTTVGTQGSHPDFKFK